MHQRQRTRGKKGLNKRKVVDVVDLQDVAGNKKKKGGKVVSDGGFEEMFNGDGWKDEAGSVVESDGSQQSEEGNCEAMLNKILEQKRKASIAKGKAALRQCLSGLHRAAKEVEKNITSESQYEALKLALDKNRLASKGQAEKIRTIRREHAKLAQEIRSKLSKEMGEVNRLSKEIESLKKDISSDTGASVPKTQLLQQSKAKADDFLAASRAFFAVRT